MPHVNSSGGDDLTSTDEVKVYKDEGEEENRSSENLLEDKHELVTETEEVSATAGPQPVHPRPLSARGPVSKPLMAPLKLMTLRSGHTTMHH